MRILFLTHYFPPEVNAPASRVYEMAKEWRRLGVEVTVLTCAPNAPSGRLFPGYRNRLWQRETMDGIEVIRVWSFLAANKGAVLRMVNYLSYMLSATLAGPFVKRPDVVVATSPQLFCGWAGVWIHWMRRRPLVLEIRDMWAESIATLTTHKKNWLARFLEAVEFRLYRMTPNLVTVGPGYHDVLVRKGVRPENVQIITNGVDLELFQPRDPDPELLQKWNLQGRFVCCYAGTIGMAHGLDVVLKAARILRSEGDDRFRFLIAGDGAERENLQADIRASRLDHVLMLGRQPKEMMPRLYSVSQCCLVPLRKAPLFETVIPSKMFEVMAMEVPIVLGVGGQAEALVREAGAGICIPPEDPAQLVAALRHLADHPRELSVMGKAGRAFVAQNFNRRTLAREYLELIQQIVDPNQRPSPTIAGEPSKIGDVSEASRR